jgi:hypothetical protein
MRVQQGENAVVQRAIVVARNAEQPVKKLLRARHGCEVNTLASSWRSSKHPAAATKGERLQQDSTAGRRSPVKENHL